MTKPTSDPQFDTNVTNSTDPGAGKRANGYADNAVFPAAEGNWLFATHGDWLKWLERQSGQPTLSGGIEDTDAGDTFTFAPTLRSPWSSTQLLSDTRSGAAGERLIASDGVVYAWQNEDADGFELRRIDGTGSPVTVTGGATLTYLAVDGERVWTITAADDLIVYDYAGAVISTTALTTPDAIACVGRDKIAIVRGSQRYIAIFDEDGTTLATYDNGAGQPIEGAVFVPGSPDESTDRLHIVWTTAVGALQVNGLVYSSPTLTSQFTFNLVVSPSAVYALHWQGREVRIVAVDTTDYIYTWALTPGLAPGAYESVDLGVAHDRVVATPLGLVGIDGTDLYLYDWEGALIAHVDATGTFFADSQLYGLACDGADLVLVRDSTTADQIYHAFLGHTGAKVRVYDASDTHPVCVSRGVVEI